MQGMPDEPLKFFKGLSFPRHNCSIVQVNELLLR
jgi:hypothetical protein